MTKTEKTYRACIAAARSIAVPFAFFGFLTLFGARRGVPDWRRIFSWETVWLITFFGYAVFMILPIDRLCSPMFRAAVTVGAILAVGSVWMSRVLYQVLIVELLEGQLLFFIMAWILLVSVYLYIPILILKRRHEAANKVLQRTCHSRAGD
jgi:hypothetical protein